MSGILCPHCGQWHREGARFCPTTGKQITTADLAAQAAAQSAPPAPAVQTGQPAPATPVGLGAAGMTGRLPPNAFLRNRYLIMRKVGQGGMAAVYQATDTVQPGALWAIKEMSDAALSAADRSYAVQSFLQEGNLLRSLNHPNLPRVIDVFTEGEKHYLVMEFVPGATLQSLLENRSQPFTEGEVLHYALQLCDVLTYLHNQNPKIIFRDLKPSNIMLIPQGQIKLIDFGIVRFFKPEKTKDTLALGTPGYAAQEAIAGQTDERSDLYSLCVTLHQLLTLNEPAKTMFNLPPVRKLNPLVSAELERILARGLQNQREARWSSVSALHAELSCLRSGGVSQAGAGMAAPYPADGPQMVAPGLGRSVSPQVAGNYQSTVRAGGEMPSYPTDASQAPTLVGQRAYIPQPVPPTRAAPSALGATSRPTTRLIMAAAQLTGKQMALLAGALIVGLVLATILLAPFLDELPINWNNVPIIAIFGALGYAAYPKRGTAFLSHVLLSTILVATLWLRLGDQGYSWAALALGAVVSGLFMELWVAFLPKFRGDRGQEGWKREALWLAIMAMIGSALFMGLTTNWLTGLDVIQWIMGATLGIVGWFLGDMLQQYLLYKRTGLRRFSR